MPIRNRSTVQNSPFRQCALRHRRRRRPANVFPVNGEYFLRHRWHCILWCVPIRSALERNQQSKKYLNNENTVCGDFAIAQIIVRLDAGAAAAEMHKVQLERFTSQWSPYFLPFSLRSYLCGRAHSASASWGNRLQDNSSFPFMLSQAKCYISSERNESEEL